jgi:hypothetical protein
MNIGNHDRPAVATEHDGDPDAEGREAFDSGKSLTDNPYDPESDADKHMKWNDGFEAASADGDDDGDDDDNDGDDDDAA